MVRYLLASNAVIGYGIEGTAYTKASAVDQYFGLIREDVDPPNPNPQTPMATSGGRRGPHVNSPDPKEYEFDVPVQPIDESVPLEVALGSRATTATVDPDASAGSGDEYQKDLFTETDRLPTMTVGHWQDGNLEAYYTGCKASLGISASQGEPLGMTFNVMAAGTEEPKTTHEAETPAAAPSLAIPNESPYRFWMLEAVDIDLSSDGSDLATVETSSSIDFNWDHGLEANNHGDGRDAYSVSEETAEEIYDMTWGIVQTDYQWYERAYGDDEPLDLTFIFNRNPTSTQTASDYREALYIRLNNTTIDQANSPAPGEGKLEPDIGLMPRNTEIEIHTAV